MSLRSDRRDLRALHNVPPSGLTLLAESGRYMLTGSGGVRDGVDVQVVDGR